MRTDEWILLLLLAVLLAFMWRWLKKWGERTAAEKEAADFPKAEWEGPYMAGKPAWGFDGFQSPDVSAEPDGPTPFGYKTSWLTIRCDDPERVISALEPRVRQSSDWSAGLTLTYGESGRVFVSPCLDGFVLVIGDIPLYRLEDLAQGFSETQAFFSCRTSGCYGWTKYVQGELIRAYTCLDGVVDEDEGELTPEELALGFDRFSPDGAIWPDEEDVLAIAAAWGIDPKFEKKTYPPGTGWLCLLA